MTNSKPELEEIVNEFASLQAKWNLKLNKKKSEILTEGEGGEIRAVRCVNSVKYLGIRVTTDRKEQLKLA
jgi:hypothetical protein